jgi:hypothetical protein
MTPKVYETIQQRDEWDLACIEMVVQNSLLGNGSPSLPREEEKSLSLSPQKLTWRFIRIQMTKGE